MADYGDRILRNRRPLPYKKHFVSYQVIMSLICVVSVKYLWYHFSVRYFLVFAFSDFVLTEPAGLV